MSRGGKRAGAGRPSKGVDAVLYVECSPEDKMLWEAAAKESGKTLSDWVRAWLGYAVTVPRTGE